MNRKNEDLKTTMTKMVMTTSSVSRGKKARGVKIATMTRDIKVYPVAPFSR